MNKKNREIELKLQVTEEAAWESLKNQIKTMPGAGGYEKISLAANYFDTEDGFLHKEHLAYRTRKEGAQWVATIKGGGSVCNGLHKRAEWNLCVDDGRPDLRVFLQTDVDQAILRELGNKELISIVQTEFIREVVILHIDGSEIEIAMDRGSIMAGKNTAPILEIELELKAGHEDAVLKLGDYFMTQFPVKRSDKSKFLRGLELKNQSVKL
ncbi:CYTH domain-containing protein [Anaerosinus massiliensis]|uniref:CYTH domain-containing protein n=1 Tax=Massilibacillus massiliensis TaxID=1806837 RepID=UPI0018FEB0B7|nr:CYTH domain-containing protein [Massilibacillus massiliensis]